MTLQSSWLSTGSGGTPSKLTHMSTFRPSWVGFASDGGLTDGQRSSFSITPFILTTAYRLDGSADVRGADLPPVSVIY